MADYYMGEITMFGFPWAPRGFALCNGTLLPISQYSALFALLGTNFGGNGVQNFQLPNLNGRAAIGQGQSPGMSLYQLGQSAGVENVVLTQPQMPSHTHLATTNVTATTTINALGAPTSRANGPGGNLLTVSEVVGPPPAAVQAFAAPGAGNPVTMAPGMASTSASATTTNQIAGGNTPVSVLQPYLAINYVIVTMGVFPSRS